MNSKKMEGPSANIISHKTAKDSAFLFSASICVSKVNALLRTSNSLLIYFYFMGGTHSFVSVNEGVGIVCTDN